MKLIGFLNRNLHTCSKIERIKLQAVCVTNIRQSFIYLRSLPSKSDKQI